MPSRLKSLRKFLAEHGVELVKEGSAKHPYRATKPGYRSYPIPAHNGLKSEVPDVYIRGVCKHFDIDPSLFFGN